MTFAKTPKLIAIFSIFMNKARMRFLIERKVTWLECAAASVCWSTMLVYYLEEPFGHLMGDEMGLPQGRTHVRGNLFSFSMPWQDIERCCAAAIASAGEADEARGVEN